MRKNDNTEFLPLYEALKELKVKKGTRVCIRVSTRSFHGTVINVLPGYVVLETNPGKRRAIIRIKDIKFIEFEKSE